VVAKIEKFADRFGIPLISLVDCPGFDNEETNDAEYIYSATELIDAMQNSTNAKISAVVGKAYGPGFIYMASKSCGGDIAFATPDSCISALSPEASVALLWNDRIRAADLSASREVLEREWREQYASPNDAALCGEIDDIVPASEMRARIASALQMLLGKNTLSPKAKK
jgi:propionyl-CoA carboxylase beta chain